MFVRRSNTRIYISVSSVDLYRVVMVQKCLPHCSTNILASQIIFLALMPLLSSKNNACALISFKGSKLMVKRSTFLKFKNLSDQSATH